MTLDGIRKMVAEEREIAEKASPGPWCRDQAQDGEILPDGTGYAGDYYETNDVIGPPIGNEEFTNDIASCIGSNNSVFIARARTSVPALCAVADALLAVVDALPICMECCSPATKRSDQRGTVFCDAHVPAPYEASGGQRVSWHDNRYAVALRALARKP